MRGDYVHNVLLVRPVAKALLLIGAIVRFEYPISSGRHPFFVDLFATLDSHRIVCEAENSPRRIARDLEKARLLRARLLLFLVPTPAVAAAVKRRIASLNAGSWPDGCAIRVLTLPAALQLLMNKSQLKSLLNVAMTLRHQIKSESPAIRGDKVQKRRLS